MKLLDGSELAGFIKQRQFQQVQVLQSQGTISKLAILQTIDDPVINTYVGLKEAYGQDIGVETQVYNIPTSEAISLIEKLNEDSSVSGIIVQLPLGDSANQEHILNTVLPKKDVDGLSEASNFIPATPTAILWLLAAYGVELKGKRVAIVGSGPLVGAPLAKVLQEMDLNVVVADINTVGLAEFLVDSEIIISATGQPGLITSDMIPQNAVVVDAGVAVDKGESLGDLDKRVYDRDDLTLTPVKGGVGPLTVCSLFENVIRAATLSDS